MSAIKYLMSFLVSIPNDCLSIKTLCLTSNNQLMLTDLNHLYKSQLQNYAQRNKFDSPIFTFKCLGPPHALRFKATVLVDGKSFESPSFFSTLKEAEQAAAKVALTSLSLESFRKARIVIISSMVPNQRFPDALYTSNNLDVKC